MLHLCLWQKVRYFIWEAQDLSQIWQIVSSMIEVIKDASIKLDRAVYMYNENINHFSYNVHSPCPNLEGIKDALCYKFKRPMIGQNCSAVCTNKGGHRDAFSNGTKHYAF